MESVEGKVYQRIEEEEGEEKWRWCKVCEGIGTNGSFGFFERVHQI